MLKHTSHIVHFHLQWPTGEVTTRHIIPSVCKRWGKAAGCAAGWKATDEAQREHRSSPQHLQCVWMSQRLSMAPCWPSEHHPDLHADGRSAAGVCRADERGSLRSWNPLSTRTAPPDHQCPPLLLAEGSAQTWEAAESRCGWGSVYYDSESGIRRDRGKEKCLLSPIRVQRHTELFSRESFTQTCWSLKNVEWDWEMIDDLRKEERNN